MVSSTSESQEIRILDSRGCLTLEAMCFSDQLLPDQRAVVERHIMSCTICAQEQTELVRVTDRLTSARPRIPVPSEISLLTRQLVLRSQALRRARTGLGKHRSRSRLRAHTPAQRKIPWYFSRIFWVTTLLGMAAALIVVLIALILVWQ